VGLSVFQDGGSEYECGMVSLGDCRFVGTFTSQLFAAIAALNRAQQHKILENKLIFVVSSPLMIRHPNFKFLGVHYKNRKFLMFS